MRGRLSLLLTTGCLAIVLVACGRASPADIDAALGITPTATLSTEQMATGTADAIADQETRTAAQANLASPGANGGDGNLAAAGNAMIGRTQFTNWCLRCHQPSGAGQGPALAGPTSPTTNLTDQQLFDLVRTGEGHPVPPGPITTATLTDRQLIDVLAYIRSQE